MKSFKQYLQESPIHLNPEHKGLLHKHLEIPEDEEIPVEKLKSAANSDDPKIRKMANFALNAKKWKHHKEELEQISEEYSKKGFYAEYEQQCYKFNTKAERNNFISKTYGAKSLTSLEAMELYKKKGGYYDGLSHHFVYLKQQKQ